MTRLVPGTFPAHRTVEGFTLLELMLVIALIGILASATGWAGRKLVQSWHLKRAGQQLYEDLKSLQARAERSGNQAMSNGALVTRRHFLVFELETRSYAAYSWVDHNANGIAENGESGRLQRTSLPFGVTYGWATGITRRACSNTDTMPGDPVTFSSPGYPPCNDQPCIKFDQHGFSSMGPGAIYLSNGKQSLAITGTRPGLFTICEWQGERWR
jgi:prepilin-type N-terminal cleavage/methylation domain-containing protein